MKNHFLHGIFATIVVSAQPSLAQSPGPEYLLGGIKALNKAASGNALDVNESQMYGYTAGLLIGISDVLVSLGYICTPQNTTIQDRAEELEKFISSDGYTDLVAELNGPASNQANVDESAIVIYALNAAYPCGS